MKLICFVLLLCEFLQSGFAMAENAEVDGGLYEWSGQDAVELAVELNVPCEPIGETIVRARSESITLAEDEVSVAEVRTPGRTSVTGLMDSVPSVYVSQDERGESDISLRGFDQRQLMILIDGVPIMSPYDARMDLGKFPAFLLDRIEIFKTNSTKLDIPVGLGGGVNLVTRTPAPCTEFEVVSEASYPYATIGSAAVSTTVDDVGFVVTGGYRFDNGWPMSARFSEERNENGGIRENSDFADGNIGTKVTYEIHRHSLEATAFFTRGTYGVPPHTMLLMPRYWKWDPWQAGHGQLVHKWRPESWLEFREHAFVTGIGNTVLSYDDAEYAAQETMASFYSEYRELSTGFGWSGSIRLEPDWANYVEFRPVLLVRYMSHDDEYRQPGQEVPEIEQEFDETSMSAWRLIGSLRNEWRFLEPAGFSAGLQYEGEFPDDSPEDVNPSIMHFYGPVASVFGWPHDTLRLQASLSRRGRFPTFKERYSPTLGGSVPNPDLKPEKAWHFGVDISWDPHEIVGVKLSGFDSEVEGLIEQRAVGTGTYMIQNIADARIAGAEVEVNLEPVDELGIDLAYTYLFATKINAPDRDELLYRPEHKAFAAVTYEPFDWWELSTGVNIIGPQNYQNDINNRYGRFGTYALVGTGTSFRVWCDHLSCMEIAGRGENILDVNYQTRYGFPGAGRRFWVSLKLTTDSGDRAGDSG